MLLNVAFLVATFYLKTFHLVFFFLRTMFHSYLKYVTINIDIRDKLLHHKHSHYKSSAANFYVFCSVYLISWLMLSCP